MAKILEHEFFNFSASISTRRFGREIMKPIWGPSFTRVASPPIECLKSEKKAKKLTFHKDFVTYSDVPQLSNSEELAPFSRLSTRLFDEIQNPVTKALYSRAVLNFFSWIATQKDSSLSAVSVTAYRDRLTSLKLSPSTINQRLCAIRRFAAEAVKDGSLSLSSAAEISGVSGKPVLTTPKSRRLPHSGAMKILGVVPSDTVKGIRDKALLGVLIGCGLRRCECTSLQVGSVQFYKDEVAELDLKDRHGDHRVLPVPNWAVPHIRSWLDRSGFVAGPLFCGLNRHGQLSGRPLSEQAILNIVRTYGELVGMRVSPHDLRRTCAKRYEQAGHEIEQIQLFLGHSNISVTHRFLNNAPEVVNARSDRFLSLDFEEEFAQPKKPVTSITRESRTSSRKAASL